jgi:2-isopropylmalate synthase
MLTAFGMTKRAGRSAGNDDVLAAVLNAGTQAVCLVGKTHDFHVTTALGITLEENIENIRASIAHCVAQQREAHFDAEHFFDGFKANPGYALQALHAAHDAGARWVVLCDTNGGTLPEEIRTITKAVIESGIPGAHLGIHCHDDTGQCRGLFTGGSRGRRAPDTGHAERSGGTLRQCLSHHAYPHLAAQTCLC